MKNITKIAAIELILLVLSLSGCMGFGEGYVKKAQEMTSADYVIGQYKFFIEKYNAVRQQGSNIVNAQRNMEAYEKQYGNPEFYTTTQANNYEDLRFSKTSFEQQYNLFVTQYNNRMRDITTNQIWMKPKGFPDYLELYVEGKPVISENESELVLPSEIPVPPPGWIPPKQ